MKKHVIGIITVAICLFFVIPFTAIKTISSEAGMFFIIAMFLFTNPLFFFISSLILSRNIKKLWWMPLLLSCLFGVSMIAIFGTSIEWFYIILYLIIAYVSMIIGFLAQHNKDKKSEQEKMNVQDL